MGNNKLANIKKASGTTAKVIKVLEWIVGVCTVVLLVGLLVCFTNRGKINEAARLYAPDYDYSENLITKVNLGILSFDVDFQKYIVEKNYAAVAMLACGVGALFTAIATVFFEFLRSIFAALNVSDTPFNEVMLKKIKIYGIAISIGALIISGVGAAAISALSTWCIFCVFDYGCTLQKESDETL